MLVARCAELMIDMTAAASPRGALSKTLPKRALTKSPETQRTPSSFFQFGLSFTLEMNSLRKVSKSWPRISSGG